MLLDFQGAQKILSTLAAQRKLGTDFLNAVSKFIGAESCYMSFDYQRSSAFRIHVILSK